MIITCVFKPASTISSTQGCIAYFKHQLLDENRWLNVFYRSIIIWREASLPVIGHRGDDEASSALCLSTQHRQPPIMPPQHTNQEDGQQIMWISNATKITIIIIDAQNIFYISYCKSKTINPYLFHTQEVKKLLVWYKLLEKYCNGVVLKKWNC